jgi:hypothetical protein
MLKSFFEQLRSEVTSERQLKTLRILRYRSHRQQVTNWIYNLTGPKSSTDILQARRNFLNQRETRDGTVERFLQSQVNQKGAVEPSRPAHKTEPDSSNEEVDNDLSLEELNLMIRFLVNGSSFEMLRTGLSSLALTYSGDGK